MNFKFYYLDQNQHIHISGGSRISQMEGHLPKRGDANLLFGIIFAENCTKMKKLDWEGGASLATRSTNAYHQFYFPEQA